MHTLTIKKLINVLFFVSKLNSLLPFLTSNSVQTNKFLASLLNRKAGIAKLVDSLPDTAWQTSWKPQIAQGTYLSSVTDRNFVSRSLLKTLMNTYSYCCLDHLRFLLMLVAFNTSTVTKPLFSLRSYISRLDYCNGMLILREVC